MTTRILLLSVLLSLFSATTNAQDGSNIIYLKPGQLDRSYIGDTVHIDFYRRSFGGQQIDTVNLVIENTYVKFIEHRVDDGFNNWFGQQYLESMEKINGYTIRVNKCRLERFETNSTIFTIYFDFYTGRSRNTPVKTEIVTAGFDNKMIAEILVSAETHNRKPEN